MRRDHYLRPPARLGSGRVTRRGLLRLPTPGRERIGAELDAARARVVAAWERPGQAALLRAIEPVAGVVAEIAGVGAGDRVLDVGCGDGNLAAACSSLGAEVEACDPAAGMVAAARERLGARAKVEVAAAARLPYADDSFDVVASCFGVPEDPRPDGAIGELARVLRPGGRLALAAWVPRGLPGRLPELVDATRPLGTGVPSPADWGLAGVVRRRLGASFGELELRTRTVRLAYPTPDDAFAALCARLPLDRPELGEVRPAFDRLLASCNDGLDRVEIAGRYLVAAGRARVDG